MSMSMYTQSPLFLSLSLSSLLAFILKLIRIIKIFFRYIYITKKCLDIYCSKSLNVYSFIRIEFISLYFLLYIILSFNVISLSFSFFFDRCDHVISIEFLFFFLAMFLLFLLFLLIKYNREIKRKVINTFEQKYI